MFFAVKMPRSGRNGRDSACGAGVKAIRIFGVCMGFLKRRAIFLTVLFFGYRSKCRVRADGFWCKCPELWKIGWLLKF